MKLEDGPIQEIYMSLQNNTISKAKLGTEIPQDLTLTSLEKTPFGLYDIMYHVSDPDDVEQMSLPGSLNGFKFPLAMTNI